MSGVCSLVCTANIVIRLVQISSLCRKIYQKIILTFNFTQKNNNKSNESPGTLQILIQFHKKS